MGPSEAVNAGCSSSLVAIQLDRKALNGRETSQVSAGVAI